MNNLNKKEQEFKSILDDIQIDLDTNVIWDSIEGDLPKKRRRLGFYWIFSLGLVLCTAFITYYLTLGFQANSEVSINKTEFLNANGFTNIQIEEKENLITMNEISFKDDHSKIKVIQPKKMIKSAIDQPVLFNLESVNSSLKSIISEESPQIPLNSTLNKSQTSINQKIEILSLPFIHEISLLAKSNSIQYPKIDLIKITDWKPFIQIYSGIHQSKIHYETNGDISKSLFDKETGKLGMSIGLDYGKIHTSGWEWFSGLNFQQITAGFQDDYSEINQSEIEGIKSIFIDENGNESARYGDINQNTLAEKTRSLYRKHQMLDLNFGIAKRILNKNRFSLKLGTGIGITAYSRHKGYYFNEFGEDIQIGNNHPYKINGMTKYFSNATMGYSISSKYQLGLKLDYAYDLNSQTKNSNFYKLKNSQYGIYFTISYRPY